nr:hypothetical protein [Actinosynnema sp. ALI-1.44]
MTDVAVGWLETPVGALHIAVTDVGLADVSWGRTRIALPAVDDPGRVAPVLAQLAEYFRGARRSFDVPIDWRRTGPAQRDVLDTLYSTVDYGESVTYGELASRSGDRVPARGSARSWARIRSRSSCRATGWWPPAVSAATAVARAGTASRSSNGC